MGSASHGDSRIAPMSLSRIHATWVSSATVVFHVSSFLGDGVPGGIATFVVDDIDRLHAEFLERGVTIDVAPTDQSWGIREMYVQDPDGNSIRFRQGRSGLPEG
jgi:uncharacterized glyoxalase superfamily protein PhnB